MRRAVLAASRVVLGPRGRAFRRALERPAEAQDRVRAHVARDLARTDYGRSLGVDGTGADFSARVPVRTWDELSPWIERQRAEEGRVVAAERVLFYEKTSGSTGPAKYVPYTATLRRTFSRMFMAWAYDILANGPALTTGRMYFSVSPTFAEAEATAHGVPVGTEDDRDYLEGWLRPLLSAFVVGPSGREREPRAFLRSVAEALIAAEDLEIISVWSPSFLLAVLEALQTWMGGSDAGDARGAVDAARGELGALDARRRALVARGAWTELWPRLKLVSCWDRGGAAPLAARLRAAFPGVLVQGKGLLATEAPVTIPLIGAPAPVPLVDDVLVELLGDDGELIPLVDGQEGAEYQVVVSPLGGLPRYALGDRVVVRGRVGETPCLDFVGRGTAVSDLVGEKLSEAFVSTVIAGLGLPPDAAASLVPVRAPRDHYVLVVDGVVSVDAARVEAALCEAHHYRQARLLGQLGPARVVVRRGAARWLVDHQSRRGLTLGNIKAAVLVTTPADDALILLLEAAT